MGILGCDPLDERWESHDETSAALAAVGVAWASSGFSPGSLFVVAVAVPFAALGGLRGLRARRP